MLSGPPEQPSNGHGVRVLLADDDRIATEMLRRTVGRWGFELSSVPDGGLAWEHLSKVEGPTLAILDWMMPAMNGPEVCRRVRLERPLANIYLVLLTSLESRADVVAGLEAGADDYIVKPFDPEELRALIHVGVRVLELTEKLSDRVNELQEALSKVKQLQRLLPICSYCKRIRGDDQYWQQVDTYMAEHTEAQFSHGICPACYVKAEQEIEDYKNRQGRN